MASFARKYGENGSRNQRAIPACGGASPGRWLEAQRQTQRNGRIIRQGNMNKEVKVFNYVTEGTFDSYIFQTLENKQRFISQP
ncbi:MAG: hypothetical protein ACLT3Y_07740 [Ruminococcus callidus]